MHDSSRGAGDDDSGGDREVGDSGDSVMMIAPRMNNHLSRLIG